MNVDAIREFCLAFPESAEKLQWGDALCFKVKGRMFAVLGLDNPRLSFKCTPETFAELIEREDIHPSPYVGRYKWVKLDRLDAVRRDELQKLIRQSYEMVAAKTPTNRSIKKRVVSKRSRRKSKRA
ncbi:MAG: MmcQ/YjbR family DNA-binding protein [Candidatus Sulfotelmatobacter sp.]